MTDESLADVEAVSEEALGDPQAPEPSPPTDDTEAVAGERARDSLGRFTRNGEAEASPDSAAQDSAPPSGEGSAGEPPPVVPAAPDATAAEAEAPLSKAVATPYAVRFGGRDHTIPDAGLTSDGHLVVQPHSVELISTYLGRGIKYEQEVPKLRSQIERLARERSEAEEYNAAVAEQFAALAQLPDEELAVAIQEFRAQYPALREKVRADRLERQLQEREQMSRPDPAEIQRQRIEAFTTTFDEVWEEAMRGQNVLTAQEQQALREELLEIRDSFVVVAPEDNPAEEIVKGEWLFHEPRMKGLIARRIKQVGDLRAEARKIADAQKQNAAVLTPTPPKAPPLSAATSPKPPASSTPSAPPKRKTREEWEMETELIAQGRIPL